MRPAAEVVRIPKVLWRKDVPKQLDKMPEPVRQKFYSWVGMIRKFGLRETRKLPGFHDELVRNSHNVLHSVRLNRAYRLFYIEHPDSIEIIEVNRHEY